MKLVLLLHNRLHLFEGLLLINRQIPDPQPNGVPILRHLGTKKRARTTNASIELPREQPIKSERSDWQLSNPSDPISKKINEQREAAPSTRHKSQGSNTCSGPQERRRRWNARRRKLHKKIPKSGKKMQNSAEWESCGYAGTLMTVMRYKGAVRHPECKNAAQGCEAESLNCAKSARQSEPLRHFLCHDLWPCRVALCGEEDALRNWASRDERCMCDRDAA